MDLVNRTPGCAAWTLGFRADGRELIVVIAKITFEIPVPGEPVKLASQQVEATKADEFAGDPGRSSPLFETDFAHTKRACDVLLVGSAHSPDGRAVAEMTAGVRVAGIVKTMRVVGDRVWRGGLGRLMPTRPVPFVLMPIGYERAFGGAHVLRQDPIEVDTYLANPVGTGYARVHRLADGLALPNFEALDDAVTNPSGPHRPVSLGPIGRNWEGRARYAGTYDARWRQERAPFWPQDFDDRYFQAAPEDQQIPFPVGGESVVLKNLSAAREERFELPRIQLPVTFIPHARPDITQPGTVDTIVFEPDARRFTMVWRTSLALSRDCFEIREIIVGEMPRGWHRARRYPRKTYYENLGALVKARRGSSRR